MREFGGERGRFVSKKNCGLRVLAGLFRFSERAEYNQDTDVF